MNEEAKNKIRSLKRVWDTDVDDKIGEEFTSPCIKSSTLYRRLTGDFSSHVLRALNTSTIKNLLDSKENQYRIKILTHPSLTEEDKTTLENVLQHRQDLNDFLDKLMERSVEKFIYKNEPYLDRQTRLDIFAQLIAKKNILIKFAFSKNPRALFHKKKGIFTFPWGDQLYHVGGNNETIGGLEINNEAFDTFQSWHERDLEVIKINEDLFEKAWENKSTKYITRELNQETLDKIIARAFPKFKKEFKVKVIRKNQKPDPIEIKWSFQDDAVKIFLEKKAGILEMATGTGKTRTALKIIDKLLNQDKINKIIIQMKGSELIDQWEKELKNWKLNRDENIRILKQNEESKDQEKFIANFKNNNIDMIFISQFFLADCLKKLKSENLGKTLIIHDEIHNLPTDNMLSQIQGLQKNIQYRLGLSATVKDDYDSQKDDRLFEEVGPIIFKFSTEDAIKKGILVEFDVHFVEYELTKSERKSKKDWMNWRHKQIQIRKMSMADIEKVFRREVSKINKLAINKISVLENYIKNRLDILEKCFIFAQEHQYGDKILNKLINYIPEIKPHYDEHADKKNLEEFATGNLKCIVNCKKLNEGINMKSLSNIILVSSESKRQLIQRLGRVLRIDEEKHPDKRAFVLDFIENRQLEKMEGADYSRYIYLNELAKIKKEN
jgi:superfamily II DNA or RNA helicase